MNRPRIHILRGGPSEEYDVSLKTGAAVFAALAESDVYEPHDIVITKGGEWLVDGMVKEPKNVLQNADGVFNALHGTYGEDGGVQHLLDMYGLPYTGSGKLASALGMHKVSAKRRAARAGIKTPRHMHVHKDASETLSDILAAASDRLGTVLVIKPVSGGSSHGVTITQDIDEAVAVVRELFKTHDDVLVEECIAGQEATCGILESYRDRALYELPATEILLRDTDVFATDQKYADTPHLVCPGRFSTTEKQQIANVARTMHEVIGARHFSRSDVRVSKDGIYFLEINTLPGLTAHSLLPHAVESIGGSYQELILHLLALALRQA